MVINEDPKEQIIKSFSRRRILALTLIYIAILFFFIVVYKLTHSGFLITSLPSNLELGLVLSLSIGTLVICYFIVWRCPSCHEFLGFKTNLKWCPQCKVVFKEDESKDKKDDDYYIKQRTRNRRKYYLVILLVIIFYSGVLLIAAHFDLPNLLFLLAVVWILIPIFNHVYNRCPKCGYNLEHDPPDCPNCKTYLKEYDWHDYN